MSAQQILTTYEALDALTERMAVAARAADWDMLTALETESRALVQKLMSGDVPAELAPPQRRRKAELIMRILGHDAEIRRLVEPRMAALEHMLEFFGNQRRLDRAYGQPAA